MSWQLTILKLMVKMPKKGEFARFKNYERKIKSSFIIYTDFEGISVQENNEKQNPEEYIQTNIKNILLAVMAIK